MAPGPVVQGKDVKAREAGGAVARVPPEDHHAALWAHGEPCRHVGGRMRAPLHRLIRLRRLAYQILAGLGLAPQDLGILLTFSLVQVANGPAVVLVSITTAAATKCQHQGSSRVELSRSCEATETLSCLADVRLARAFLAKPERRKRLHAAPSGGHTRLLCPLESPGLFPHAGLAHCVHRHRVQVSLRPSVCPATIAEELLPPRPHEELGGRHPVPQPMAAAAVAPHPPPDFPHAQQLAILPARQVRGPQPRGELVETPALPVGVARVQGPAPGVARLLHAPGHPAGEKAQDVQQHLIVQLCKAGPRLR
mmetsp:Transcript_97340/g.231593  ORF Transcript_97340/g.231593 Transcript_97340/m.231593 type:complete len:309 (-) Transcript_97340:231-1157(-)